MSLMDVGIAPRTIHLVVDGLAWATLPATTPHMSRVNRTDVVSEGATMPGRSWLVRHGKAAAICAHVGVSTRAVCVVDLRSASCRQDAHLYFVFGCLSFRF